MSNTTNSSTLSLGARPIVIIGAGRSGTNMLRDVLCKLQGVSTWPCDEINYIWRYGNRSADTDEFHANQMTPEIRKFIQHQFTLMAGRTQWDNCAPENRVLLEKTCANSLRVEFVDSALTDCKYIYLVRDGRDVISSAAKRWTATLDIPYLLAKARYVPSKDIPYYASRYLINRISKLMNRNSRLAIWGPQFKGWQNAVSTENLQTICAAQWSRCIERSDEAFEHIDPARVHKIYYEQLVTNPTGTIESISNFIGIPSSFSDISAACQGINNNSIAKTSNNTSEKALKVMQSNLSKHGYKS